MSHSARLVADPHGIRAACFADLRAQAAQLVGEVRIPTHPTSRRPANVGTVAVQPDAFRLFRERPQPEARSPTGAASTRRSIAAAAPKRASAAPRNAGAWPGRLRPDDYADMRHGQCNFWAADDRFRRGCAWGSTGLVSQGSRLRALGQKWQ